MGEINKRYAYKKKSLLGVRFCEAIIDRTLCPLLINSSPKKMNTATTTKPENNL